MYPTKPTIKLPASYETLNLPQIELSHHPHGAKAVTPVVIIILNRPEKHNAFTPDMARSLEEAFRMFHLDDRVKVVVLTGAGRMFCAGRVDTDGLTDKLTIICFSGGRVAVAMHRCQKPTIIALQGSAVGVGMTMTLPAAIRICHQKSKYGFVFTRRGLPLESCSSYFLPRLIGLSRAMFLITTGGVYPPEPRYFGDLFTEALPEANQVLPRALELATDMADNNIDYIVVAITKKASSLSSRRGNPSSRRISKGTGHGTTHGGLRQTLSGSQRVKKRLLSYELFLSGSFCALSSNNRWPPKSTDALNAMVATNWCNPETTPETYDLQPREALNTGNLEYYQKCEHTLGPSIQTISMFDKIRAILTIA
ncbi:conserved hypothetical protein [Aspergillus terreus NIH2624]|uniref:Enoyl-CoA hydratase n=1 Tax=Aspergillus terreus (strain NIH 2624 / FGSC A1156) TaxID=341663 RepID=Q0C952_ASPTN|nr:uncharacterized protein ATEG_09782 [Aspergillus terreus NIH2624]EAU29973.1 conserved hypothetical protein [Aspergillus terreus NIH2624]